MNRGTKGLEMWCRRQIEGYPGVEIHNMTTSWKNGMAFCALVHHFRPDLIDFDKLNKSDVYFNNDLAFTLAEKHLGIPALLDASDMAMYDVPDRLSILTYLSQYYQRFASQESKITKDKSATISNTTPPPQKMAHIVGVPKREPCKQCGLPVFFAERLAIDGSFYHRKCLRCARCDSQLTPGSFYETEVDGVFCCETCPDEEKKMRLGNNNVERISELSPDEQRQSFSEKLAMFQTNGKGLLQKSLSDEEKSKSLKRLSELYSKTHDTNDTKQTINESNDVIKDGPKNTDEEIEVAEASTSENSDEDDAKPPLPKTLPPKSSPSPPAVQTPKPKLPPIPSKANVLNKLYGKSHQENVKTNANTSGAKLKIQTSAEPSVVTNEDNEQSSQQIEPFDKSANEKNVLEIPKTNSRLDDEVNSIEINLNTNNSLPLDALNSLTNVTKENAESIATSQHNANVHHFEDKDSNQIDDNDNDNINVEQVTNTKKVMQLGTIDFSTDNESAMCELEQEQEQEHEQNEKQEKKPDDNRETEQQQQHQQPSINSNDCNENKSLDKYDTNKLEHITDIREQSGSISDNDSQKMVRSIALVQSPEQKQTALHSPRFNRSSVDAEILSKQTERKKSIEVDEKTNITDAHEPFEQLNIELVPHLATTQLSLNADSENNVASNVVQSDESEKILNTLDTNDLDMMKPVPRQRVAVNVYLEEITNNLMAALPPTPSKRRQKSSASEKFTAKHHQDNCNNLDVEPSDLPESSLSSEDNEHKKCDTIYPNALNPFGSDDEDETENNEKNDSVEPSKKRKDSLNPFDSEDDEIELMKDSKPKKPTTNNRISTNPFGSDSENEADDVLSAKRTPVPTPRKPLNGLQTTPEASPRMYSTLHPKMRLHGDDDLRGSNASLASPMTNIRTSSTLNRSSMVHGSMSSLASSTLRHKKGRAPDIPTSVRASISASSSPSHSVRATPVSRKKRTAPLPPKHQSMKSDVFASAQYLTVASKLNSSLDSRHTISSESVIDLDNSINFPALIESNYVSSSNDMSFSSTEPSNFTSAEYKSNELSCDQLNESTPKKAAESSNAQRLIHVDKSLLDDLAGENIAEMPAEEEVTYRRKIIPHEIITPIKSDLPSATDRQCEKMKENKESKNRQSQISLPSNVLDDSNQVYSPNKSSYGKWKRRKGPAPSLPVPPRKVIQMLPLQEIRHELEVIEVQQQGLEKQGVMLEKMIRERCEGTENENQPLSECKPNSKEVEDLILQLFELVNEKNELFRRQAELMYLRRQHRLEQEQADIEYEIRVLMAQPECNKTDSDKAREEALISRLVDVVQLRNEVIESLEMDRIREAEEDQSIKERLELHTAKREEELCQQTPVKLSKKEKKKQKESKKLAKQKKMDADKDADESEISQTEKSKEKKKKKKFLF